MKTIQVSPRTGQIIRYPETFDDARQLLHDLDARLERDCGWALSHEGGVVSFSRIGEGEVNATNCAALFLYLWHHNLDAGLCKRAAEAYTREYGEQL